MPERGEDESIITSSDEEDQALTVGEMKSFDKPADMLHGATS